MSNNRVTNLLMQARNLIANKAFWTKGTLARNNNRQQVKTDSPNACSYCAVGSVERAKHQFGYTAAEQFEARRLLDTIAGRKGYSSVISLNDASGTSHEKLVGTFDEAIQESLAR